MKNAILAILLWLTCVNLHAQGTIVWEAKFVNHGQVEETIQMFFGPDVPTGYFVNVPCDGLVHHHYFFTDLGTISGFETEDSAIGYWGRYDPLPVTTPNGNSFVGEDAGSMAFGEYINTGNESSFLGEVGVNTDVFTAVDMGEFDVTRNGVATPDHKKTLWVVEDSATTALSAGVYREGADKIVTALNDLKTAVRAIGGGEATGPDPGDAPNGDPLPTTGDVTTSISGQQAGGVTQSAEIASYIPGGTTGTGMSENGFSNDTKAGGSFTFYTTPTIAAFDQSFDFKPSDFWPNWTDYADVIREVFLLIIAMAWVITEQRRFEEYFRTWWGTGEKTTKPEPLQIAVPGAGWGKQISTALFMTAALVGIVGATITLYNSHLATIIGSETLLTIFGSASGEMEAISSSGLFSKAYGLLNMFVPIVAIFQFFGVHYLLGWTMPATWTAALWTAKHVHV